ncbi:MAG: hypothetical protein GF398_17980 [Chitinivibrionales bacterium]|nr:hypothetical protein [Chitinivibrionales bacterium]
MLNETLVTTGVPAQGIVTLYGELAGDVTGSAFRMPRRRFTAVGRSFDEAGQVERFSITGRNLTRTGTRRAGIEIVQNRYKGFVRIHFHGK